MISEITETDTKKIILSVAMLIANFKWLTQSWLSSSVCSKKLCNTAGFFLYVLSLNQGMYAYFTKNIIFTSCYGIFYLLRYCLLLQKLSASEVRLKKQIIKQMNSLVNIVSIMVAKARAKPIADHWGYN